MGSPQAKSSAAAYETYRGLQDQYMAQGARGLRAQQLRAGEGLAQGGALPGQNEAFDIHRALGIDKGAAAQRIDIQNQMGAQKGAVAGGNEMGAISGADWGAKLANYLSQSRVAQGASQLENMGKMLGWQLGTAQQAGSSSMGAAGRELSAISMMPKVNQTYADILGAANLGLSAYGGAKQANWFLPSGGIQAGGNQFSGGIGGAFTDTSGLLSVGGNE